MDTIAVALGLIGGGLVSAAMAWLGRHAGLKAISLLILVACLSIGGGVWMLWP